MIERDVINLLGESLGHLPRWVRQHPDWPEWRDDVIDDVDRVGVLPEDAILPVAERIRRLEAQRDDAPIVREVPPDERSVGLARILAAEASEDPEVARFRLDELQGELVSP